MKKVTKITLFVIAFLTIVISIAAVVMRNAISGDKLFYMNSALGYVYAVSYRWVGLASIVLILFWVLLAVIKRKAFSVTLTNWMVKFGNKVKADKESIDTGLPLSGVSVDKKICTNAADKCQKRVNSAHSAEKWR